MKIKIVLISLLAVVAFVVPGCGLVQGVIGTKGGTVSNLWSDVPPLPNAAKADINIPPLAQLVIQGFIQAANADSSNDTRLDKFDFIAYETADTPKQVSDFYSIEKMKAAGWNTADMPGCTSTTGDSGAGGFCAFGKKGANNQQTVLLVMPVQDDSTKKTQVFFVRFEATKKTS
jgi:hypothetical protein